MGQRHKPCNFLCDIITQRCNQILSYNTTRPQRHLREKGQSRLFCYFFGAHKSTCNPHVIFMSLLKVLPIFALKKELLLNTNEQLFLLHRCVQKWLFPKYFPYFFFYNFDYSRHFKHAI